jgi:hypothetical protein
MTVCVELVRFLLAKPGNKCAMLLVGAHPIVGREWRAELLSVCGLLALDRYLQTVPGGGSCTWIR